ncbi:MAG TPA: ATP-binding cassette domain-containing protein, partial [Ornithinibacter sp.]|nr:ATP-binding cassette domain-containing protein [Ornithinibacter sp.]
MTTLTSVASLELDQLTKSYGGTRAVDGISFSAGRGVVGLLGPNGAGKTTLLRMVATVLAPDSGTLRLFGLDPADPHERTEIRRRLGYLPQSPG